MIEPHADMRTVATNMMQLYAAYVQAGFNEIQALKLIEAHIMAK